MKVRKLIAEEVKFSYEAEPSDIPIEGNVSAIDEETDCKAETWVLSELQDGNTWAWAFVIVKAQWYDFNGVDCLGGSWKSEEEFIKSTYEEMKNEALCDLNLTIKEKVKQISELNDD